MITCTLKDKKYAVDFISGRALREMEPAAKMYAQIVALSNAAVKGEEIPQEEQISVTDAMDVMIRWFCLLFGKEYGLIQLIEDETERQKALEDLNSRYNDERKAAAQEYAETLSSIVMPVWNQPEIQQASQQMDELFTKLREYSMASESEKPALLADLQALSADMDEGALTEYLSLMTQIQSLLDSGMSEAEVQALFPDIDFSSQLDQFAGIVSYGFRH